VDVSQRQIGKAAGGDLLLADGIVPGLRGVNLPVEQADMELPVGGGGEAVGIGRETFGRYSAVVNDILFDYFLASRFQDYAGLPLKRFSRRVYTALAWNYRHLPERFQGFIWHFILTDRLCRYASLTGIQQSLEIMTRYRGLQIDPAQTPLFMQEHGERLQKIFREFFPELHERCKQSIYLKS